MLRVLDMAGLSGGGECWRPARYGDAQSVRWSRSIVGLVFANADNARQQVGGKRNGLPTHPAPPGRRDWDGHYLWAMVVKCTKRRYGKRDGQGSLLKVVAAARVVVEQSDSSIIVDKEEGKRTVIA
jgi:hypothetical protein